jgi:hypothetical protein
MKTKLLIFIWFICALQLNAQSFITAGTNYSVLSDAPGFSFFGKQQIRNFKLTPSVGYGYRVQINDKWTFQPSILLGDLGGINSPEKPSTVFALYAISLNHTVLYKPLPWLSLGLSPTLNYNVYAGITSKAVIIDHRGTRSYDKKLFSWSSLAGNSKLNRLVFSLMPTLTFHLKERWSLDCFYRQDINSVGYPTRTLNYTLRGYGTGINLRYQLDYKTPSLIHRKKT